MDELVYVVCGFGRSAAVLRAACGRARAKARKARALSMTKDGFGHA